MRGHDLVVIGASAGGVDAMRDLLSELPASLPAAVLVVVHVSPNGSKLAQVLDRGSALPVSEAYDGGLIRAGTVHVAPADHHLLVSDGRMRVVRGPRENLSRPAIDPLFRSAARHYGPRAVGIVLTGYLSDGASGLVEIRERGGVTIVQDPEEAPYPDMPRNALSRGPVDHCLPLKDIPAMILRLARVPPGKGEAGRLPREFDGPPAGLSCPECMGPIREIPTNGLPEFRCQVGHGFAAETFEVAQNELVERALWTAVSALSDKAALAARLEERMRRARLTSLAAGYRAKARKALADARLIRSLLENGAKSRVAKRGRRRT